MQLVVASLIFYAKSLNFIHNYSARQPKTKCRLSFCDDLHIACFKKFHKEPIDGKSSDQRFLLFKGQASRPYSRMGRHLVLINSKTTSSDALLLIFPNISFTTL